MDSKRGTKKHYRTQTRGQRPIQPQAQGQLHVQPQAQAQPQAQGQLHVQPQQQEQNGSTISEHSFVSELVV
jgi:hypothetical protein